MQARVLTIDRQRLHLEVENAIRFHSRYTFACRDQMLNPNDRVEFDFKTEPTGTLIVITSIMPSVESQVG